jgi:hypothetical protein
MQAAKALHKPPERYGFVQQFAKNDWAAALYLDIFMQETGGEFFDKRGKVNFNTPAVIAPQCNTWSTSTTPPQSPDRYCEIRSVTCRFLRPSPRSSGAFAPTSSGRRW